MFNKVIVLCLALGAVHAGVYHGVHHGGGSSVSARRQDGHGNYAFSYDIVDGKGATNSRSEVGDGAGNKKGAYTLHDSDGRARVVEYVADGHGFRAAVKTNERGTAASAPAAAVINSPYAGPVAPVDHNHALVGHGLAGHHGLVGHGLAGHHGLVGHGLVGLGHVGAPSAYSTAINHAGWATHHGVGLGLGHGLGLAHGGLGLGHGLGLAHGKGLHW